MKRDTLDQIAALRNHLFLYMCLCVHIFLCVLFSFLHIWGMAGLNLISLCCYVFMMFIRKDFSQDSIVASYFEIIAFAAISTIMLGRQAGFQLYIVGMISVVFYLAYDKENRRFIYQWIGCAVVILLVILDPVIRNAFENYKEMVSPYARHLYLLNLVITLATVIIISFLYAQELSRMNREFTDITDELDYKATHDQLTGLYNRYHMTRVIDELEESRQKALIISMIDVDDFKKINDEYGHGFGDDVLCMIAKMAKEHLKDFHVARWGGEEFLCISENLDWEHGKQALENFRDMIEQQKLSCKGETVGITVTLGVVSGPMPEEIDHLIKKADDLLYIGKNSNKNCVVTQENKAEYENNMWKRRKTDR